MLAAIDLLGLAVPTAALSGVTAGCLAIDQIAVPRAARVDVAEPVAVARQLSDHWAYVVDVEVRPARP